MLEAVIALLCTGVAVRAMRAARRDPRFTPRVVAEHALAIALFVTYGGLGGWVVVELGSRPLFARSGDASAAIGTGIFLVWLALGLVFLLAFLRRSLGRARGRPPGASG